MKIKSGNLAGQSVFRSVISPKASVLIITLWVLFMLASFAVILGYNVRQKLSLATQLTQRDEARFISQANIDLAISEIKSKEERDFLSLSSQGLDSINEQTAEDTTKDKIAFISNKYAIFAEEAKININRASMPVLKRLFRILLGYGEIETQELAAAIVDWRDKDSMLSIPLGSAEDFYYTGLRYPYECKDADFDCLAELNLVKGVTPEVFERIKDFVTIYGRGLVNVNVASREVLFALGLSDYIASKIVAFRCGKDKRCGSEDDNYFTSTSEVVTLLANFCVLNEAQKRQLEDVAARDLTVESNYFMIRSAVRFNQRQSAYRGSCIVDALGKVVYWEEF